MKKLLSLAGISAFVFLSGCATGSSTAGNYQFAESAVRNAQVAGAETYAVEEFTSATATFARARQLMQNDRSDRAQKLLELTIAQADLARAISEAEHAEATLQQLQTY